MKAHEGDMLAAQRGPHDFVAGRCSYCGSMPFDDAMRLLHTSGTKYCVADWKYGWPHKLYLDNAKFYCEHLRDVTDEQLVAFNLVTLPLTGIAFVREPEQPGELFFSAPFGGHCPFGVVP